MHPFEEALYQTNSLKKQKLCPLGSSSVTISKNAIIGTTQRDGKRNVYQSLRFFAETLQAQNHPHEYFHSR
jgi:hypothetical protein